MAEVFRSLAFGAEGFEKLVAIKRMLPHLSADQQFVSMFINEAKLAASLNHATIAQIYDFGCIEDLYFLSMEFVEGKDVSDLIRVLRDQDRAAPVELACHMIVEALNGLDHAHRKADSFGKPLNLIHRDMSPHNLIISYEGEVKIVDFGIAKAKSTTVHTTGGVLKGKYSYMSPEQAHGLVLDHRTDLFSLGICFYELLTLTKMFQGTGDMKVLEKVRAADFTRPREINQNIPDELEGLLLRALEKNPEDRWATAAQWREELEAFLFRSNRQYSTSRLASFMKEIFREEIAREARELAEDAENAQKMRSNARRAAQLESARTTEVLRSNDLDDFSPLANRVPGAGQETDADVAAETLPETARNIKSLGMLENELKRAERHAVLEDLDHLEELSDDDELVEMQVGEDPENDLMPTVEMSRPTAYSEDDHISAGRPPIREVAQQPQEQAAPELDSPSELHPLDGTEPPVDPDEHSFDLVSIGRTGEVALDPSDFDNDLSALDERQRPLSRTKKPQKSGGRSKRRRPPLTLMVAIALTALVTCAAIVLWPWLIDGKSGQPVKDTGAAVAAVGHGSTGRSHIEWPGHMVPLRRQRAAPDGGPAAPAADPEPASSQGQTATREGGDPKPATSTRPDKSSAQIGEVTEENRIQSGGGHKKADKKRKRRKPRRRASRCPSRGWGKVDVGVSDGWAVVYIDGRKVRSAPLLGHRLRAGRHKVELRDRHNQLVRRWNICVPADSKVELLHP